MRMKFPRLAVRGVIVHESRLLLVNAYAGESSDLWCAPGGGVEAGSGLDDNLIREVHEETGLAVEIGALLAVNEFKTRDDSFHQVELFFACRLQDPSIAQNWQDPEGVVTRRRFFSEAELGHVRFKPDCLRDLAFRPRGSAVYDRLEYLVG